MTMPSTPPTPSVIGYLADNWSGYNADTAALIVNPNAGSLDLLAWCCGEVRSLQAAAQALSAAGELELGDFLAVFLHRLDPLHNVMTLTMDRMHAAQRSLPV